MRPKRLTVDWQTCTDRRADGSLVVFSKKITTEDGSPPQIEDTYGGEPYTILGKVTCDRASSEEDARERERECTPQVDTVQLCDVDASGRRTVKFTRTTTTPCEGAKTVVDRKEDGTVFTATAQAGECQEPLPPDVITWASCTVRRPDGSLTVFTRRITTPGGGGTPKIWNMFGGEPYNTGEATHPDYKVTCGPDDETEASARAKERDCKPKVESVELCDVDATGRRTVKFTRTTTTPCEGSPTVADTRNGATYVPKDAGPCVAPQPKEEWWSCTDTNDGRSITFTWGRITQPDGKVTEPAFYGGKPYKIKGKTSCKKVGSRAEAEKLEKGCPEVTRYKCTETIKTGGGMLLTHSQRWRGQSGSEYSRAADGRVTWIAPGRGPYVYNKIEGWIFDDRHLKVTFEKPVLIKSFWMGGFEPRGESIRLPDGAEPVSLSALRVMGFSWDQATHTLTSINRGGAKVSDKLQFRMTKPVTEWNFTTLKEVVYCAVGDIEIEGAVEEVSYDKTETFNCDWTVNTKTTRNGSSYTEKGTNRTCKKV